MLALLAALASHAALIFGLEQWQVHRWTAPSLEARRPFEIRRAQVRPQTAVVARPAVDWKSLPLARDAVLRSVPVADGQTLEAALQATRPQITLPAIAPPIQKLPDLAQESARAAQTIIARSSDEQALIRAEFERLSQGNLSGEPAAGNPPASSTGNEAGTGVRGAALPGAGAPGQGALPSFDDVRADFRNLEGGLGPRLPEPVLVRLPSDFVFDFDSDRIRSSATPLLRQALELILRSPRARVQVDGHTDTFGTDSYNQGLSERRAGNVAIWLRGQLPSDRGDDYQFQPRGFGRTRPLVNPRGNISEQERNRRVELVIQPLL